MPQIDTIPFEPRLSESLPGRVRFVELWPFSVGELKRTHERFVDAVFATEFGETP